MSKTRRNIYIEDKTWEQIKKVARKKSYELDKNVTATEIIIEAIDKYLNEN